MKVLFLFGGLAHYLKGLYNKLSREYNYDVCVVVPEKKAKTFGHGVKEYSKQKSDDYKIIPATEFKTYYGKYFYKSFVTILKNEKPDIIVTCWPYNFGFIYYPKLKKYLKNKNIKLVYREIPFQVPMYGDSVRHYRNEFFYTEDLQPPNFNSFISFLKIKLLEQNRKSFYRLCDAILLYTEQGKEIVKSYGVDDEKIFITYNSVDTDEIFRIKKELQKELPEENSHKSIVHVGRLVKWKRVDTLIFAFEKVLQKFPDAVLYIIGTGPELDDLKKLAIDLSINKQVEFLGGIYDNKVLGKYMLQASMYVLAGMGGLSINEAMAYGKPVICSVCDGTEKHLVRDKHNGLYYIEGDKDDLAEKIKYLLSNPELISQMGGNSEKIIEEEINIQTYTEAFVKAFNYLNSI